MPPRCRCRWLRPRAKRTRWPARTTTPAAISRRWWTCFAKWRELSHPVCRRGGRRAEPLNEVGEIVATYDLIASPLSRSGFEPFGEVVQIEGSRHYTINEGWAERYHDLACVDVTAAGGRPLINIFQARPRTLPLKIKGVERHALGSQAFIPLASSRFLIVVAPAGAAPKP